MLTKLPEVAEEVSTDAEEIMAESSQVAEHATAVVAEAIEVAEELTEEAAGKVIELVTVLEDEKPSDEK